MSNSNYQKSFAPIRFKTENAELYIERSHRRKSYGKKSRLKAITYKTIEVWAMMTINKIYADNRVQLNIGRISCEDAHKIGIHNFIKRGYFLTVI